MYSACWVALNLRRSKKFAFLIAGVLVVGCGESEENALGDQGVAASEESSVEPRDRQSWGGTKIYDEVCDRCHKMGVDAAPELGDRQAWAPRLAKGKEVLFAHVIDGYKKCRREAAVISAPSASCVPP